MKVLWLINAPFAQLCQAAGLPLQVKEGWIQGFYNSIKDRLNEDGRSIRMSIAFPQFVSEQTMEGEIEGCSYFGFYKEEDKPYKYNERVTGRLRSILDKVAPDVVHIAGTEYDHARSMIRAFPYPQRLVVSIQGLTGVYAGHYMADLPVKVQRGFTFRDLVKRDNLRQDQKKYEKRGSMEEEVIRSVGNIIGRTEWDRACTRRLNPEAKYYHCGEILRPSFYSGETWSYEKCRKHSIFVSQGYYPIKGLHYMVEALADIVKVYPDARLYVGGGMTLNDQGLKQKLRRKNYQKYLGELIGRYGLREHIEFLPSLKEEQMKEQYLKANVFVSPSAIENSPNSVGEAMILGVPCVSSLVGGVADMLQHGVQGYTYQHDAPYMLAHYVMKVFGQCEKQPREIRIMTENAREQGSRLFDREINGGRILEIYGGIYERSREKQRE